MIKRYFAAPWFVLYGLCAVTVLLCALVGHPGGDAWSPLGLALLLSGALVLSAVVMERSLGPDAPALTATVIFPTVVGSALVSGSIDALLMAATAAGLALALFRELPVHRILPEVWDDEDGESAFWGLVRLVVAGFLIALPLVWFPWQAGFLLVALLAIPKRDRMACAVGFGVGAVLGLLVGMQLGSTDVLRGAFASLASFPPPGAVGSLLWRNLQVFLLGPHVGLLVAFFPVVLVMMGFEVRRLKMVLLLSFLVAVLVPLLVTPFDVLGLAGAEPAETVRYNRHVLVAFPALLFVTSRAFSPAVRLGVALVALFLLGPLFVDSWLRAPLRAMGQEATAQQLHDLAGTLNQPVMSRLPLETTQQHLKTAWFTPPEETAERVPVDDELGASIFVRRLDTQALVDDSALRVQAGKAARFLVATKSEVETLWVQVYGAAPSTVELEGAEVEQMMFQPTGGVALEIRPKQVLSQHPAWFWSESVVFYAFHILLPPGPAGDSAYRLEFNTFVTPTGGDGNDEGAA